MMTRIGLTCFLIFDLVVALIEFDKDEILISVFLDFQFYIDFGGFGENEEGLISVIFNLQFGNALVKTRV